MLIALLAFLLSDKEKGRDIAATTVKDGHSPFMCWETNVERK